MLKILYTVNAYCKLRSRPFNTPLANIYSTGKGIKRRE